MLTPGEHQDRTSKVGSHHRRCPDGKDLSEREWELGPLSAQSEIHVVVWWIQEIELVTAKIIPDDISSRKILHVRKVCRLKTGGEVCKIGALKTREKFRDGNID